MSRLLFCGCLKRLRRRQDKTKLNQWQNVQQSSSAILTQPGIKVRQGSKVRHNSKVKSGLSHLNQSNLSYLGLSGSSASLEFDLRKDKLPFDNEGMKKLEEMGFYFDGTILGQGSFSVVWQCKFKSIDSNSNESIEKDLACKKVDVELMQTRHKRELQEAIDDINQEIQIHQSIVHPNLVDMFHVHRFYDKTNLSSCLIYTELCQGTLFEFVDNIMGKSHQNYNEKLLNEDQNGRWIIQIVKGLQYLHFGEKKIALPNGNVKKCCTPISHGDIHAGNIMFNGTNPFIFKLTDFGLSEIINDNQQWYIENQLNNDVYDLAKPLIQTTLDSVKSLELQELFQYELIDQLNYKQKANNFGISESLMMMLMQMTSKNQLKINAIYLLQTEWMQRFIPLYHSTGVLFQK